jgi:hypothetical protein
MGLDDDFVVCFWIDHAIDCSVGIDMVLVDIGLEVFEPELLAGGFEAGGRSVVQVTMEKVEGVVV